VRLNNIQWPFSIELLSTVEMLFHNDHCKYKTKVGSVQYALIVFRVILPFVAGHIRMPTIISIYLSLRVPRFQFQRRFIILWRLCLFLNLMSKLVSICSKNLKLWCPNIIIYNKFRSQTITYNIETRLCIILAPNIASIRHFGHIAMKFVNKDVM